MPRCDREPKIVCDYEARQSATSSCTRNKMAYISGTHVTMCGVDHAAVIATTRILSSRHMGGTRPSQNSRDQLFAPTPELKLQNIPCQIH